MEVEADIFTVFTGWNPSSTAEMYLEELADWHEIAIRRHEESKQGQA